jgi:hypothetical protein
MTPILTSAKLNKLVDNLMADTARVISNKVKQFGERQKLQIQSERRLAAGLPDASGPQVKAPDGLPVKFNTKKPIPKLLLPVTTAHKNMLKRAVAAGRRGDLLFPKPQKRLPALDLTTAPTQEVHKAANRLIGRTLDQMEKGGKKGSFFAPVIDRAFAGSRLFSKADQKNIRQLLSKQKDGKPATASDQMTLVYKEMKRLEATMKAKPSRETFQKLHKLAVVQRAMRGATAGAIFDNLNLNKRELGSLKAAFSKGIPSSTVVVARGAAQAMKRLIPQDLLSKNPLSLNHDNKGTRTAYDAKTGHIRTNSKTSIGDVLREYGRQIEARDPNIRRVMSEYVGQRAKASGSRAMRLDRVDKRFPKGTAPKVSPGTTQPGTRVVTAEGTGTLAHVMGSMRSKDAFVALYQEDPNLVKVSLGALYGSRASTPKQQAPYAPNALRAKQIQERLTGIKSDA